MTIKFDAHGFDNSDHQPGWYELGEGQVSHKMFVPILDSDTSGNPTELGFIPTKTPFLILKKTPKTSKDYNLQIKSEGYVVLLQDKIGFIFLTRYNQITPLLDFNSSVEVEKIEDETHNSDNT